MFQNNLSPYNIEKLKRQRDDIDNLINTYQQMPQQPVNNFINTNNTQSPSVDMVEWRVLNENEVVDNLYVNNKTLFINDKNMVLKGVDGKLEKWNIEKTYPIDPKDERISQLEKEIIELKGMINSEYSKSVEPVISKSKSDDDADELVKSKSKTTSK